MNGSVYMQVVLQSFSGINTSSPIDNTGTASTARAETRLRPTPHGQELCVWELIGIAQAQESNRPHKLQRLSNYSYGATLLNDTTAQSPVQLVP